MERADKAWVAIAVRATAPNGNFDPQTLEGLPEVVRRYFTHAIALGTPLRGTVELSMRSPFLLGDKRSYQQYAMEARWILAPPHEFV